MALYIHPENQKLLWNAIIKSPRFISLESKEIWFKNIIQHFYESNRHVQLNGNALLQLNRDTIQLMMNQLKSMVEPAASINAISNSESFTGSTASRESFTSVSHYVKDSKSANETLYSDTSRPVYNKNETRDYILGQKQEMLTKQFSSKQQEYNSMLLKETPKDVNFKETQLDTPISNIDELIKKHIMERDAELKKYAPPPPHGTGTTTGTGILKIDSAASEPVLENIIEFKDTSRRVKFESEVIKNSLEGLSPTLISKIKDEIRDEIRKEIQAEFTKLRLEFSGKAVESVPKSNDSLENIPETNFNVVSILS